MKSFIIFWTKFVLLFLLIFSINKASAQCPVNLDFELGDFTGWQCYTGTFANGNLILNASLPTAGRHDMLSAIPGNGLDHYGSFPQNCPNGSRHSIRLGNNSVGGQAEGISYTFTIPANQDKFNLIYNYAVVLNDGGHAANIQPRLTIQVQNLTDNTTDQCSSFDFAVNANLPGFFTSPISAANSPVRCKDWSAASINLDGNQGKTIKISFTTTDCGNTAHFGYAYIDVNTECGSSFVGATFCPDDTLVKVTAPYGYQTYRWFNINNANLGNQQTLTLVPPISPGDSVFVELTPFNGYGCVSTLKAILWDTLTVVANAGPDKSICLNTPVQIGTPPKLGLVYSWLPATGLNDNDIANPLASPSVSTSYVLTVTNSGGGCKTTDTVNVNVPILSDSIQLVGSSSYCLGTGQSSTLIVLPADSIQWYKNNVAIVGANQPQLNVIQTGTYYATLFSFGGCSLTTATKQINVFAKPTAAFTINANPQCLESNQFVFTNSSTLASGTLQYAWDLGDGTLDTTTNITHKYLTPSVDTVKLRATSSDGCISDTAIVVTVNQGADAVFSTNFTEQCFKNNKFIFTNTSTINNNNIQYLWKFGDGAQAITKNAIHSYLTLGTYNVNLSTNAFGGCKKDSSIIVTVDPSPNAAFAVNANPQCLAGNQFIFTNLSKIKYGPLQFNWDLGNGILTTDTSVTYSYPVAGNYFVKLVVSATGSCVDSVIVPIVVHPFPNPDFSISPICQNVQVPIYNRTFNNTSSTINYLWDFGNGHIDVNKNPIYSYPFAGTYKVKLTINTAECPLSFNTKIDSVVIDAPQIGIKYADADAAYNFPESLTARSIGNNIIWTPATNLTDRYSYTPKFIGITPQLYTIQLRSATGCYTIDTQFVNTHKKIEIYVPNAFTPNGDGINERLRPVLIGFTKVNYFRVYDRWGKLLFSMNSDQPGWDGKINNITQDTQSVIWIIEAVDVDGVIHTKQGVTVLYK